MCRSLTRLFPAGYFFTENLGRLSRVAKQLQVGMVGANTGAISQAGVPFGGVGESGFGREGSKYGQYCGLQSACAGISC